MNRREFLAASAAALTLPLSKIASVAAAVGERRFLYIATPGIRNYVQYGGVGVLVFDINNGYTFVRRIPTWSVPAGQQPENVKGVCASAATARLYVTTIRRLLCLDLTTDKILWDKAPDGGCDRPSISPDSKILYTPSFEGPHWNVIDAMTGDTIKTLVMNNRAHNTLFGPDGEYVYLEGLASHDLHVVNPQAHTVVKTVGPFADNIRPFTINAKQTRCYVNCDKLLGFEVGDIETGKKLHHVEVQGYQQGPVDRHGCPSHGIGLTPDETEIWVSDGHNKMMHVFDNTVTPPKQKASISVRDQPGWVTFSIDGTHAYPSTGEVFDTKSKKLIASLQDEEKRQIGSEKLLEVVFDGSKVVRVGDQFGIGRKTA
jgi:DNA-binding beta-propeller fold protein YncE